VGQADAPAIFVGQHQVVDLPLVLYAYDLDQHRVSVTSGRFSTPSEASESRDAVFHSARLDLEPVDDFAELKRWSKKMR
jgi:hypothetical protein